VPDRGAGSPGDAPPPGRRQDVALVAEILRGRGVPQQDVVALAEERDALAEQLTHEQAVILGAISLLPRAEIRGGAGSGKTWLGARAGAPAQPERPARGADLLLAWPGRVPPSYGRDLAAPPPAGVRRGVPQPRPAVGSGIRLGRRLRLLGAQAARGDAAAGCRPAGRTALRRGGGRRVAGLRRGLVAGAPRRAARRGDRRRVRLHRRGPGRVRPATAARPYRWSLSSWTTTCATRGRSARSSTR
jgi:hypothetical protein